MCLRGRGQYQSLKLQRGEAFLVEPEKVRLTVEELLRSHFAAQCDKRLWDVLQADSFWRVAELPLVVEPGIDTASKVAAHFRFDPRQSSYYRQAAEFLGLARLDEIHHRYELTDLGREYAGRPADERRQLLAGILVHFPPMRAVLELSAKAGGRGVTKQQIADSHRASLKNPQIHPRPPRLHVAGVAALVGGRHWRG